MELLQKPDLSQLRNLVFKKVIRGLQSSVSVDQIATQILSELSTSMVLIDHPQQRQEFVREIYNLIQGAHKIRQFNYQHESPERNQNVAKALNEILYRFRIRYSRYF